MFCSAVEAAVASASVWQTPLASAAGSTPYIRAYICTIRRDGDRLYLLRIRRCDLTGVQCKPFDAKTWRDFRPVAGQCQVVENRLKSLLRTPLKHRQPKEKGGL